MNLLTLIMLTAVAQSGDATTKETVANVADTAGVTVRVSASRSVEIATTPDDAQAVRDRAETTGGIWINCETMKFTVTAEGTGLECGECSFGTSSGITGTAQLAVFDLSKGTVTLTGGESTPVELVLKKEQQKLLSKSIEMSVPVRDLQVPNQNSAPVRGAAFPPSAQFLPDSSDFDAIRPAATKERSLRTY